MPAIITDRFRISNAEEFKDSFSSKNRYMFIGRVRAWEATDDFPLADDNNPPIPSDSVESRYEHWREMIAAKNIGASDVSLAVPRHDWTSGTVYTQYDSSDPDLFLKSFYVLNSNFDVYKCIENNGGVASTVEPTGTGTSLITTGDGYVWKYMYSLSATDTDKFLTPQHQPISLAPDDGSDQDLVQDAAVDGEILSIEVTNGGSGYTSATVTITGDGTSATADANIVSGAVDSIDMTAFGSGYKTATVTITGDGSGAEARANLSPPGGHGANAPQELGAYYLTMQTSFAFGESGDFTTENDFRTIGIIEEPFAFGTTNVFSDTTARQTTRLDVSNVVGTFEDDEVVTGSSSGATARVVDTGTSGQIFVNNVVGTFTTADTITGSTSTATADVDAIVDPELEEYTGKILYAEQRKPIPRASDQTEHVLITVEY